MLVTSTCNLYATASSPNPRVREDLVDSTKVSIQQTPRGLGNDWSAGTPSRNKRGNVSILRDSTIRAQSSILRSPNKDALEALEGGAYLATLAYVAILREVRENVEGEKGTVD
jgi:hypothetical protein